MFAFAGRLSCVIIFVLLIWVQSPGSRVFSPQNVRLKICISLLFLDLLNFTFLSESESESCSYFEAKGSRAVSCALEPEASTSLHPALDWLSGELSVLRSSCYSIYVFVDLFLKYKCGNMSNSLTLLLWRAMGGWVSWAIGGPQIYSPTVTSLVTKIRWHWLKEEAYHW